VQIQEFLTRRNSCKKILSKRLKTGTFKTFKTPPKPHSCEKILRKKEKKSLGNLAGMGFWGPKNEFLKTGIGNLAFFRRGPSFLYVHARPTPLIWLILI